MSPAKVSISTLAPPLPSPGRPAGPTLRRAPAHLEHGAGALRPLRYPFSFGRLAFVLAGLLPLALSALALAPQLAPWVERYRAPPERPAQATPPPAPTPARPVKQAPKKAKRSPAMPPPASEGAAQGVVPSAVPESPAPKEAPNEPAAPPPP
jgi:hypothetical protein